MKPRINEQVARQIAAMIIEDLHELKDSRSFDEVIPSRLSMSVCDAIIESPGHNLDMLLGLLYVLMLPVSESHPRAIALLGLGMSQGLVDSPFHKGVVEAFNRTRLALSEYHDEEAGSFTEDSERVRYLMSAFSLLLNAYYLYLIAPSAALTIAVIARKLLYENGLAHVADEIVLN